MCLVAKSVDPDKTLHSIAYDLDVHCLLRPAVRMLWIKMVKHCVTGNCIHFSHALRNFVFGVFEQ